MQLVTGADALLTEHVYLADARVRALLVREAWILLRDACAVAERHGLAVGNLPRTGSLAEARATSAALKRALARELAPPRTDSIGWKPPVFLGTLVGVVLAVLLFFFW